MINVFGGEFGQEELDEIASSFKNSWLGMGQKSFLLEQQLAKRFNVSDFVLLDNCSNALCLAIKLLNLPKRSKIIVPSFAFVSCVNSIILNDHIPVFADVDYHTCNITQETVEQVMHSEVKAIIVVHYAGHPVKIDTELPIINDCAHAVDSKYNGEYLASLKDVSVFSFDPVKNLPSCELGGFTSNNSELIEQARNHRFCGIEKTGYWNKNKDKFWEYNIANIWHKNIPNDISASIALSQLKKLDKNQERRKEIWNRYQKELVNVDKPPEVPKNCQHSYFTYLIKTKNRDKLIRKMIDNDVFVTLKFHPLHFNKIYGYKGKLPITERLNEFGLNLPLHSCLTDDDVSKIINLINK